MSEQSIKRAGDFFSQIGEKYDQLAPNYDIRMRHWGAKLRMKLLARASGKTLEVAIGTGLSLQSYPAQFFEFSEHLSDETDKSQIIGIDASQRMLSLAQLKATALRLRFECHLMDAQNLDFEDSSFETVICIMSTCVFPEPVKALNEMARVCKRSGKVLLLEHARVTKLGIGWLQDLLAPISVRNWGCHLNHDILKSIRSSSLNIISEEWILGGFLGMIELRAKRQQ